MCVLLDKPTKLLILGGTGDATALASQAQSFPHLTVITSLAGRTQDSHDLGQGLPGSIRVGGFGGVAGLVAYLQAEQIDWVIDATHPFAAQMSWHSAEATAALGIPLLRLNRRPWQPEPGDDWRGVASHAEAAALLPSLGQRIFLTIGRQELAAYAHLQDLWFLMRMIDPPTSPIPPGQVLLERGPFSLEMERQLLTTHQIQVVVSKNSGGAATYAKLVAAREQQIPVVMIQRPAAPVVEEVATVAAALQWLKRKLAG